MRNRCVIVEVLFEWNSMLGVEVFVDASLFKTDCYIYQKQNEEIIPLFYDFFTFTPTKRNYDIYKRELRFIMVFTKKYTHIFQYSQTSIIHTDHKPLVGFLNNNTHEDIFARWAIQLRSLNVKIQHVQGTKNTAADGLFRTIFNADYTSTELTKTLRKEVNEHETTDRQ